MNTFKCALCTQTFESNKSLVNHKTAHAKENRIFTCNRCQRSFTDHCEYLLHEVTHLHYKDEHKCIECGVAKKRIAFPIHILTHFNKVKQSCQFCGIILTIDKLKQHILEHTAVKQKKKCQECGKMISEMKYELHIATHKNIKKFSCQYCSKSFTQKYSRDYHVKIHTGEMSEVCTICGVWLRDTKDLKRHVSGHKEDIKYQCDYCKKIFFSKQLLVQDIKRHTIGCRCLCKGCKFSAPTRDEVLKHQKESHYYCKVCHVSFSRGQYFTKHNKTMSHKEAALRMKKTEYKLRKNR